MAWCESCKKQGLKKEDVEFCEETRKVLCAGCYCRRHPMWRPDLQVLPPMPEPSKFTYELHFSNANGFIAKLGLGSATLGFHMPMADIEKVFGPKSRPKLA